ncbi:MAG TPA: hypothetical protein PKV86_05215, partial [Syntrophobacteraceae bacterium]|nr:hypothetical protein [Syntrophobacteraceae bacterium]
ELFLSFQPRFLAIWGASVGSRSQVFTQTIEIDQIAPIRAKYHMDLIGDPGGAIANTVNLCV